MKFFLLILLVFTSSFSFALTVDDLEISCGSTNSCRDYKERFKTLISRYQDAGHLKESVKLFLKDGGLKDFEYELVKNSNKNILKVNFQIKKIIKEINVTLETKMETTFSKKLLPIKEGDFFDQDKIDESEQIIRSNMAERGFLLESIKSNISLNEDDVFVNFIIKINKIKKIKRFDILSDNEMLRVFVNQRLLPLINRAPDLIKIRSTLVNIEQELFSSGYYYNNLILNEIVPIDEVWVVPKIKLNYDQMYLFTIEGSKLFSRPEMIAVIRESVKRSIKTIDKNIVIRELKNMYKKHAFLDVEISVLEKFYSDKFQKNIRHFFVSIKEKKRTRFKSISFVGNNLFSNKYLNKLFYSQASDLASRNYFDEDFLTSFTDTIKKEYFKNGYVQVEISKPILNLKENYYEVEYKINEFDQTKVEKVEFLGIDQELKNQLFEKIRNKPGLPFNPLVFAEDIKDVQELIKEQGYYYAEIKNLENNALIKYSDDNLDLSIIYDIDLGPKVYLDKVIVIGNIHTKSQVITREIFINKGDELNPDKVEALKNSLNGLGLFSNVKVVPLKETMRDGYVDLLISVKERPFGTIELAPGYRTDLGPKVSSGIIYNNVGGMNRTLSFRALVNNRVKGSTLDPRRRQQPRENWEYNVRLSYNEPYLLNYPVSYTLAVSTLRRRFYSFDADILRFNNSLQKDLTRWFTMSLTHQYETIAQTDATNLIDNGYFQVGALIPSFNFDFRNNRANPTKGAFLNFSVENANPLFLSQKSSDLEISYLKMVSRNNFYIPLGTFGTIAMSASMGKEQNESSNGYIPSLKVFRLSGVDIVRGFDNSEINRLSDGRDISSVKVTDDAYFINLKVEPRYFLNDETMIGFFYDAGRVYVNSFEPSNLRESAGISFKYLTPVGSLNFDYGVKLDRRTYPDGTKEDPGRFHVSIGFF
jgi:outer membrane protein insertion porin family